VFDEDLPAACPPAHALDCGYEVAFRLIPTENPTAEDFKSKAAEGKRCPPGNNECSWASCSLFTVKPNDLIKLKRIKEKYKYIAELNIDEGCGQSVSANNHIDFWRYVGFDPSKVVVSVEVFGA
jgi:hypothetical protein